VSAPRQVVIREDDAVLTSCEIAASIMFSLERNINDLAISEDQRRKLLIIKRAIKQEDTPPCPAPTPAS
jgi:hypothetical protein